MAVEVWVGVHRHLVRCTRRRVWWPHLHSGHLCVGWLSAHPRARVRWSSGSVPDYHVDTPRGDAAPDGPPPPPRYTLGGLLARGTPPPPPRPLPTSMPSQDPPKPDVGTFPYH